MVRGLKTFANHWFMTILL